MYFNPCKYRVQLCIYKDFYSSLFYMQKMGHILVNHANILGTIIPLNLLEQY
jgi:hypothetical protein